MTADSPSIRADGLHRRYGKRVALAALNLVWDRGVLGLLGPNGAGKSTLMRILATIDSPSDGRLELFGKGVGEMRDEARGRIGYLPQDMGAPFGLSAKEVVSYVGLLRRLPGDLDSQVEEALEVAGAAGFADERVRALSGGQRQRTAIAAAIVGEPDLVLLDEPTSGLDPQQRVAFRDLLRRLGAGAAVVMSTHLVEDVALGCDAVLVLNGGKATFFGSVDELTSLGRRQQGSPTTSPLELGYLAALGA